MAPDYKTHDPKGWCGDPRRGAALGRSTIHDAPKDAEVRLYLKRVRLNGDYDSNGTYFGYTPGTFIYWYADVAGMVDAVVRARSRDDAKVQILSYYPKAKFFH